MSDLSILFLEKIKNSKVLEIAKDLGINSEIFTNSKILELYSNHNKSLFSTLFYLMIFLLIACRSYKGDQVIIFF